MIQVIPVTGHSNTQSLVSALEEARLRYCVVGRAKDFHHDWPVVIPGVGRFGDGMKYLQDSGLGELLREHRGLLAPMVGVCLGMQLLFDYGSEGVVQRGLGIFSGHVRKFPASLNRPSLNVGWRELRCSVEQPPPVKAAYFCHSYRATEVEPEELLAVAFHNGESFPAIVKKGGVTGFQFHPELSGGAGAELLTTSLSVASQQWN